MYERFDLHLLMHPRSFSSLPLYLVAEYWELSTTCSQSLATKLDILTPTFMPTVDGNAEMPTAQDNAPSVDVTTLAPELLESHPYVQELKKKYSAAHSGMDNANLTKKQLEAEIARLKVMAGEEAESVEEEPKPSFVTREELEMKAWEIAHAQDLELYADDEYKQELDRGVPRDVALKYAKIRQQKNPNSAQVLRQQAMASQGSSSTRDLSDIEITDEDRADMKLWGYSEETIRKQKQLKKARG